MAQQARIDTAALDKLLDPYDRTNAPGFAVGVALGGKPAYRRGVGLASIELPIALSPTIRMRIGSTTKHFCALAVLLLAEEGKLSIDDSPRRVLPELPAWAEPLTIRQLMAHTSGMRDSFDIYLHTVPLDRVAAPDMLLRQAMALDDTDFAPGAGWSYNNAGYVLLTEIVERIGGQSFADFLHERILAPVGMVNSMLRPLDATLVPNSATLHLPRADGGWKQGVFPVPVTGMGGMVSTVDDMLRWLRHMSQPVIGSARTWAAMRTPLNANGYGLGLQMEGHRGLQTIHHAGGVVGGSNQMIKVLDHDLDLIVMTNGRGAMDLLNLVDAILEACIPGLPPRPEDAGAIGPNGTFHSRETGRVLTLVEHAGKQLLDLGGMTVPAHESGDGALSIAIPFMSDLRVTPVREAGAVVSLDLVEHGSSDRLGRVEPPADLGAASVAGQYRNPAAGLAATIAAEPSGGTVLHLASASGAVDYAMAPIGPELWQGKAKSDLPLVVTLEFGPDGFRLSTGRTKRLPFARAA